MLLEGNFFWKYSQGLLHSLFIIGNYDLEILNNNLQPKMFSNTHKRLGIHFGKKMHHYQQRDTVLVFF